MCLAKGLDLKAANLHFLQHPYSKKIYKLTKRFFLIMLKELLKKLIYGPLMISVDIFFVREIKGLENLPEGSYIVASNHASYLDILCLSFNVYKTTGREIQYLGKKELFDNPVMGYVMKASNVIPIDRSKKNELAFKEAIASLKAGGVIV